MIDLVILGVLSLLIVALLWNNLRVGLKLKKLSAKFLQEALDKSIIIENLNKELDKRNPNSVEQTEGFLKFISESRDWAFEYIEEVQEALSKFKDKVEPRLKYANTYGTATGQTVHLNVIEEITLAYLELKKIMPEDDPKQDKLN
jgi:predicted unusual protein kinase regulating ubiquinone biosynthesis (AarF/ABC1/UbiB family)